MIDIIASNKRLSVNEDWQPSFEEFEFTIRKHGLHLDIKATYKKMYGKSNKISTGSSKSNESVQRRKKTSRDIKL